MIVRIFDVQAGACALITTDDNRHIMVDCKRSRTGWTPADYLLSRGIRRLDMLVITNYDEDHCSGFPDLLDRIEIGQLLRNRSVSPDRIRQLKDEGGIGAGVEALADAVEKLFTSSTPADRRIQTSKFDWDAWCLSPAVAGDDSNNLSLVFEARCGNMNFLFTGDLECWGWDQLRPQVEPALKRTNVLLAPHHGRENAQWAPFKELLRDNIFTVVSDKGHMHQTQATAVPFYRQCSAGGPFGFDGADRYVLTTRNDGSIEFEQQPSGKWTVGTYEERYGDIEA